MRILSYFLVFIAGILAAFAIGYVRLRQEMGKPLIGPRTFGDIRIVSEKNPLDPNYRFLIIQRNLAPVILIIQDPNKKTEEFVIYRDKNRPIFSLYTPRPRMPNWMASYSYDPNINQGYSSLLDLNFDGRFDSKYEYSQSGEKHASIFYNNDWLPVEKGNFWWARNKANYYRFIQKSGWQQTDVNTVEEARKNQPHYKEDLFPVWGRK